jgi:hypothetical protein
MPISNDPSTWPSGDQVWTVCQAIASAEGANVAGSVPDRTNNPGDLSKGDEHGQPVSGYTVNSADGENLIVFASKDAGWAALYAKIANIAAGNSSVYSPLMTWTQIAQKYAGNWQAWVANVTGFLEVSPSDVFINYFTGGMPGPTDPAPRPKPGRVKPAGHK